MLPGSIHSAPFHLKRGYGRKTPAPPDIPMHGFTTEFAFCCFVQGRKTANKTIRRNMHEKTSNLYAAMPCNDTAAHAGGGSGGGQ